MSFRDVIGAITTIALLLSQGVVSQNILTAGQTGFAGPRAAASLSGAGPGIAATGGVPGQTQLLQGPSLNLQVYNGYPVTWGSFGRYSRCSATCGFGVRRRQRACYAYITTSTGQIIIATNAGVPIIAGGATAGVGTAGVVPGAIPAASATLTGSVAAAVPAVSPISQPFPAPIGPSTRGCTGLIVESQRCNLPACISLGNWGAWITWTACDKPCGGGTRRRTRVCIGGAVCGVGLDFETTPCNIRACKIPAVWGQWSPYGQCPVSCGGGIVQRNRLCVGGVPGIDCPGNDEEAVPCSERPCEFYSWGPWISSTPCSASCGPGTQLRRRLCWNNNVPQPGLTQCGNLPNAFTETITCFGPDCYAWGPWVDQGVCSSRCGPGTRTRRRSCLKNGVPALGITRCGNLPEGYAVTVPCSNPDCYAWGPWTRISTCSVSCGSGKINRRRECLRNNVPLPGATVCGNLIGEFNDVITCFAAPCYSWGPWVSQGRCGTSCGQGFQRRTRACLKNNIPERVFGRCGNLVGPLTDQIPCTAPDCYAWGPWASSSVCSASCGQGTITRTRTCLRNNVPLPSPFTSCGNIPGQSTSTIVCFAPPCFTLGTWTSLPCSASCGRGTVRKTRVCLRDGIPSPRPVLRCGNIQEPLILNEPCNAPDCYNWGPWIPGPCASICGPGTRSRTRVCFVNGVPSRDNTRCGNLIGPFSDSVPCVGPPCFSWGSWADGPCSARCGAGVIRKTRVCLRDNRPVPRAFRCGNLIGPFTATEPCTAPDCYAWGPWVPGPCSAVCGSGSQPRTRVCLRNNVPVVGATSCGNLIGGFSDSIPCSGPPCFTWGTWSASGCSARCGSGIITKTRVCLRDGQPVPRLRRCGSLGGPFTDTEPCAAPDCYAWGIWTLGKCSAVCGVGSISRTRVCLRNDIPVIGGTSCGNLPGVFSDAITCNGPPCYDWGQWSSTSCSATCGTGTIIKSRVCLRNSQPVTDYGIGPRKCGELPGPFQITEACRSPVECYNYGLWQDWQGCSVTCGAGSEIRIRACVTSGRVVERNFCERIGLNIFTESRPCIRPKCITYNYGIWQAWQGCSVSCDSGTEVRVRACVTNLGDIVERRICEDIGLRVFTDTRPCVRPPCITYNYGIWQAWQGCSVSCGSGTEVRVRACVTNLGDIVERRICEDIGLRVFTETRSCVRPRCISYSYGIWQAWQGCSVSCGTGTEYRIRACVTNFGDVVEGRQCEAIGLTVFRETRACRRPPCISYNYGIWQAWQGCSVSCGSGTEVRVRACVTNLGDIVERRICEDIGLRVFTDTRPCVRPPCITYNYGIWQAWQGCSVSCGSGTEVRVRACVTNLGDIVERRICEDIGLRVFTETRSCVRPRCISYSYGIWQAWQGCSVSCGTGTEYRIRACVTNFGDVVEGRQCEAIGLTVFRETRACRRPPCISYNYGIWQAWQGCSVSCGSGTEVRVRACVTNLGDIVERRICEDIGLRVFTETRSCVRPRCISYSYGIWQAWQGCSVSCGTGTEYRIRACVTNFGDVVEGRQCEAIGLTVFRETRACRRPPCISYNYGIWQAWQGCSVSCGSGTEVRVRACVTNLGDIVERRICEDIGLRVFTETRPCVRPPCISYSYGIWQAWQGCSVSCGTGTEYRIRACVTNFGDVVEGRQCEAIGLTVFRETRACTRPPCISYSYGIWQAWQGCSVSCGTGTEYRIRACVTNFGDVVEGRQCEAIGLTVFRETRACRRPPCITYSYGVWQAWQGCSVSCGTGTEYRIRACVTNFGDVVEGRQCEAIGLTVFRETRACTRPPCISYSYGIWQAWQGCSVSCGTGTEYRIRACVTNFGDVVEGRQCEVIGLTVFRETRACTRPACISYSYSIWQAWQGCSVTCDSGTEYRVRTCVTNFGDVADRRQCEVIGFNVFRETRPCTREPCITYRFSLWSGWSRCRVPCGEGTQTRTRTCVTNLGGQADRSRCSIDDEEFVMIIKCVKQACPGSWLQWNSWSVCTKPCNTGISTRSRQCSSDKCNGRPEDTKLCNTQECRPEQLVDGSWTAWSLWTSCDKPCGGVQTMRRRCIGSCRDEYLRTRSCEPCIPIGPGPTLVLTCDFNPTQRRDCGYPGIPYDKCNKDGCCYDNSRLDNIWCFYAEGISESGVVVSGGSRSVSGGSVEIVQGGGGGGISTSSGFTSIVTVDGETTITESETDTRGNTITSVSVEKADGSVEEVVSGGRAVTSEGTWLQWTPCERPCEGSRIRFKICPAGQVCAEEVSNFESEDCPCPVLKSGDEE